MSPASDLPGAKPDLPDPNRRPDDAALGGIASTADKGLMDAAERSSERGDDPATGLASTGNAIGGGQAPRTDMGGKNEPGSAPGSGGPAGREALQAGTATGASAGAGASTGASRTGSDAAPQDVVPAAPGTGGAASASSGAQRPSEPPEGPLESLGKAVSEVVTGTLPENEPPNDPRSRGQGGR